MIRYGPPGEKKARSDWRSDRAQEKQTKTGEKISERPAPIKKLLAQHGRCWLFEVTEEKNTFYLIEKNDLVLRFSLKFQAEGRFLRLAKKEPHP
jgi:hypothetical protein